MCRERALLRYAARLTQEPASITRADLDALRAESWDDRAILDLNQVVAYFNGSYTLLMMPVGSLSAIYSETVSHTRLRRPVSPLARF